MERVLLQEPHWLRGALPPEEARIPWLVQVFFAGQLADEEILTLFERQAEQLRARLERYDRVPQESAVYVETIGSPREVFFWMLTLDYGVTVNRAMLGWIKGVIERLRCGEQPPRQGFVKI